MKCLIKLLRHVNTVRPNEQVIIFSCFLRFLDIISYALKSVLQIDCIRFDGSIDKDQKRNAQQRFTDAVGPKILLITSGSGGVGLNMQSASIVVQIEIWWNRNCERQADARCYRQGQTKEVKVFRLLPFNNATLAVMFARPSYLVLSDQRFDGAVFDLNSTEASYMVDATAEYKGSGEDLEDESSENSRYSDAAISRTVIYYQGWHYGPFDLADGQALAIPSFTA